MFIFVLPILMIAGAIGFFFDSPHLIIIGGVAAILDAVIGLFKKNKKGILTPLMAALLGVMLTQAFIPWWLGALLGLTIEGAVTSVIFLVSLVVLAKRQSS